VEIKKIEKKKKKKLEHRARNERKILIKKIYIKKKVEGTIENNKLPGSIHDRSSRRDVMKIGETICILTWVSTVQRVTWAIRHCAWKACPQGKT
jgi:hypothetical protein